ncbi:hypothetical protein IGJ39_002376 [Enterococcus sp. AZ140]
MLNYKFLIYPTISSLIIILFVSFMPKTIITTGWIFSNFLSMSVILTISFFYLFEKHSFIQMEVVKCESIFRFFRYKLAVLFNRNVIYTAILSITFTTLSYIKVGNADFKIISIYSLALILLLSLSGYLMLVTSFSFKNIWAPYITIIMIYSFYFYAFVNINLSPYFNPFISYITSFSEFQGYGTEPTYFSHFGIIGFLFSNLLFWGLGHLIFHIKVRKIDL